MTGHPPGGDAFPGIPGEPPFPGRPGGPTPGQYPQPQQPRSQQHYPPQPQQPYPQNPYPQQFPLAAQPPATAQGYGQHGGPPQQPPGPEQPWPPQPPKPRRWGLVFGGIGAAALLLVSTGVVVWSLSGTHGPYASLPGCSTLLSAEILDAVPTSVNPRVSGEFVDIEDMDYVEEGDIEEMEVLGYLQCRVTDRDDLDLMWLSVSLHEAHAQDGEAALELNEGLVEEMEDRRQDWADGEMRDSIPDWVGRGWRETSTGDGGMVGFFEDETTHHDRSAQGVLDFVTDNVSVWVSYNLYDSFDEPEVLDYMEDLSEQVYRQISREAEPA